MPECLHQHAMDLKVIFLNVSQHWSIVCQIAVLNETTPSHNHRVAWSWT